MENTADRYGKALSFWREKQIRTDAELAEALNGQGIFYAYHSGNLENEHITYNDTREIFEHDGVVSYTGDLRTLFEIRNAKNAYELFLVSFREKRPLNESLVKEFQKLLTLNTCDERRYQLGERSGEYKHHDYVTGKNEIGAAPGDVAEEMRKLLDELQNAPAEQLLRAAAYYHVKFENIHPFADGNGRAGRLTMNYFLVINDHPLITIHQEDRKAYYAALEAWDERQELAPMEAFLREQTIKTWEKQLGRRYQS